MGLLPVAASLPGVGMRFGHAPYRFEGNEEQLELVVTFNEPFADDEYALVAMSDHPSCVCALQQKAPSSAVLTVVRTRFTPAPQGAIQWIAVGRRAADPQ
ncbi:WIAG-tail domain [Cohnella sp. REN36]